MSRIGKKPITVPSGVDVTIDGQHVAVKGPRGSLELDIAGKIAIDRDGEELNVTRPDDARTNRALHGLTRTLIQNMVIGVSDGFVKELEIVGVGYRAAASAPTRLELQLGFSHPVVVEAPDGITFEVPTPIRISVRSLGAIEAARMLAYGAITRSSASPRLRPRPGTPNARYW